jgi:hypothetical protein
MREDVPFPCPFDYDKLSALAESRYRTDLCLLTSLEHRLPFDATASTRGTDLSCKKQAGEHHSLSGSSSCCLLRLGPLK